jgi:aminomethyltransferase
MADQPADDLKTVVLNDKHVALGGRMVPFSGYNRCRCNTPPASSPSTNGPASMPVSSMSRIWGPSFLVLDDKSGDGEADHAAVAEVVEPLICGDIKGLKPGQIRYTLLLNDRAAPMTT